MFSKIQENLDIKFQYASINGYKKLKEHEQPANLPTITHYKVFP